MPEPDNAALARRAVEAKILDEGLARSLLERATAEECGLAEAARREGLDELILVALMALPLDASRSVRAASAPIRPGSKVGGFTLGKLLGRGGMGAVFEGTNDAGVRRAIKITSFNQGVDSAEHKARFLQEARSLAKVTHPNVCKVHSVGEQEGVGYCVLELIEGPSVDRLLEKGPLSVPQALGVAEQAARALHAAHAAGIVHRDVKPSNLIVRTDTGSTVLMDFGLARDDRAERLTQSGILLGTLRYMPPEQAAGVRNLVDRRSDVYALGMSLYEMLTGDLPFPAESAVELMRMIAMVQPEAPSRSRPELSRDVDAVVLKALAKLPGSRYETALAMAEDLARARSGERVLARPADGLRTVTLALLGVAVVLAVVVSLIVASALRGDEAARLGAARTAFEKARAPFLRARLGLDAPSDLAPLEAAARALEKAAGAGSAGTAMRAAATREMRLAAAEAALARRDGLAARSALGPSDDTVEWSLVAALADLATGDAARARDALAAIAKKARGEPVGFAARIGLVRAELALGSARAAMKELTATEGLVSPSADDERAAIAKTRGLVLLALAEDAARRGAAEECLAALDDLERADPARGPDARRRAVLTALGGRKETKPAPLLLLLEKLCRKAPGAFTDRALAEPLSELASALFAEEDLPGAARAYELACRSDPEIPLPAEVWRQLPSVIGARVSFMGARPEHIDGAAAIECSALRVGEEVGGLVAAFETKKVIEALERLSQKEPDDWVPRLALALHVESQEQALSFATAALASTTAPPRARGLAYALRAHIFEKLGRPAEELADLMKALELAFGKPDAACLRVAELHLRADRFGEALEWAERAGREARERLEKSDRGPDALYEGRPRGRPLSPAGSSAARKTLLLAGMAVAKARFSLGDATQGEMRARDTISAWAKDDADTNFALGVLSEWGDALRAKGEAAKGEAIHLAVARLRPKR